MFCISERLGEGRQAIQSLYFYSGLVPQSKQILATIQPGKIRSLYSSVEELPSTAM